MDEEVSQWLKEKISSFAKRDVIVQNTVRIFKERCNKFRRYSRFGCNLDYHGLCTIEYNTREELQSEFNARMTLP